MPQNVDVTLQQRVRRLLGLIGGPAIGVIEAVQPVSIISGFLDQRQPQLEKGDTLVRRFTASSSQGGIANKFPVAVLRTTNPRNVIWVQDIVFSGALEEGIPVGRSSYTTISAFTHAAYDDWRLPFQELAASEVEVGNNSDDAAPAILVETIIRHPANETVVYLCDFVLVSAENSPSGLNALVCYSGVGLGLAVTFRGVVFSFMP